MVKIVRAKGGRWLQVNSVFRHNQADAYTQAIQSLSMEERHVYNGAIWIWLFLGKGMSVSNNRMILVYEPHQYMNDTPV